VENKFQSTNAKLPTQRYTHDCEENPQPGHGQQRDALTSPQLWGNLSKQNFYGQINTS